MGHRRHGVGSPLAGLQVIEFASYVTGPFAGALLADMGARVIKLEEPKKGDPFRGWGTGGYSPTFRSLNRSKKSLAIDIKKPAGRDIALKLAERSDVLIENFRPGVMERLGLGYDVVRSRNPGLIYCSISGFGESGPYRDRPGYDTIGQALGGVLGLMTEMARPVAPGYSFSDHVTGMSACYGILAGLAGRARSGEGCRVETSLLQSTVSFLAENAVRYFDDGAAPSRADRARLAQTFAFVAGDGLPFVIHLSSPEKFWTGLVRAVADHRLETDARFADRAGRIRHYDELSRMLGSIFSTRPRTEWLQALHDNDVPAAPVNRLDEVFDDTAVKALGMVHDVVHPEMGSTRLVSGPVTIRGYAPQMCAPPMLGQDSDELLHELGLEDSDIATLRLEEAK